MLSNQIRSYFGQIEMYYRHNPYGGYGAAMAGAAAGAAYRYGRKRYRGYMRPSPRRCVRSKNPRYGWTKLEKKESTVEFTAVLPTNTSAVQLVNGISAGTSNTQRIGDTMVITQISMRFCAVATGTSVNACYRFMLLWDTQPNKALATLEDIFVGTSPHSPLDFMELDNRNRFRTVWNSGVFAIGANTNDNDNRTFEFYCDCKAETVWTGGSGDIGSLTSGALLLVHISNKGVTGNVATVDFQTRIRFNDGQSSRNARFFNKRTVGSLNSL